MPSQAANPVKKPRHKPVTYEKAPFPADQLQVGDILVLDIGYGPRSDDQPCTITHIGLVDSLFSGPQPYVEVREPNGQTFGVGAWLFSGLPTAPNQ